jgi:hypothetical protein
LAKGALTTLALSMVIPVALGLAVLVLMAVLVTVPFFTATGFLGDAALLVFNLTAHIVFILKFVTGYRNLKIILQKKKY